MPGSLYFYLLATGMMQIAFTSSSFLVESPMGKIQGMEMIATNGKKYVGFQGIPYAKPPLGNLRFAKPQPHPVFESVFNATGPIVECPQPTELIFSEDQEPGQEDCLILNIFTKDLSKDSKARKKVLVFIHGGGFIVASSKHFNAGTFVTEQDILVVTINYRLGVLGFLSTENEASPGNYGMWDQVLALKWVKDNIASFGGDPDDVTISGVSAGGASVAILSITPFAEGLFTKAFPMSGTATSVFGNAFDAQLPALQVAKSADCWDGETDKKVGLAESQAIMKCLKERPLSDFTKFSDFSLFKPKFVPRVDGEFIPQLPSKLMKDEQYLESVGYFDISYLFGIDNNEHVLMHHSLEVMTEVINAMEDMSEEDKSSIVSNLIYETKKVYTKSRLGIDDPPEVLIDQIMDWYCKRSVNDSLSEIMTDLSFLMPTYDYVDALARKNSRNVYLFYFNHYPAFMKGNYRGTPHAVDMVYWFDLDLVQLEKLLMVGIDGGLDEEDLELKSMFSSLIAEFVRSGNPGKALSSKLPSGWPSYDLEGFHYLDFGLDPIIRTHLGREKRKLWTETIPKWVSQLGEHSQHTEL